MLLFPLRSVPIVPAEAPDASPHTLARPGHRLRCGPAGLPVQPQLGTHFPRPRCFVSHVPSLKGEEILNIEIAFRLGLQASLASAQHQGAAPPCDSRPWVQAAVAHGAWQR